MRPTICPRRERSSSPSGHTRGTLRTPRADDLRARHTRYGGDADVRRSRPMRARHVGRSPPILSWDLAYVWCDCASWPPCFREGFFQPGKWPNCHRRTPKTNVCTPGGCRRRSSTRPSGPRGRPDDTCGRPGGCGGPGRSRTRASVAPGRVTTKEPDAAHAQRATSSCAASGSPPGTSRNADVTARPRSRTMSAGRGTAPRYSPIRSLSSEPFARKTPKRDLQFLQTSKIDFV